MSIAIPIHRAAISSGGAPSWVPRLDGIAADLLFDFAGRRAWQGGRPATDASLVSVTRATTTAYGRSASGIYVPYGANVLRYDDVIGGALIEEARTNDGLWSRDLTNAAWVKVGCTAALDQTGADGAANAATRLTATAANATVLQTLVKASAQRTASFSLKRLAGSGNILITIDGGVTWTPQTVTTDWTRAAVTQTLANPVFGVQIASSGDQIAVDFTQNEVGAFATSPMPTTTAAASRATDVLLCNLPVVLQGLASYTQAWDGWYFANTPSGNQFAAWLNDGTTSNQIGLYKPVSNLPTVARTPPGGGPVSLVAVTPNSSLRLAYAATDNDVALLQTGQAVRTATGVGFPAGLNKLNVGSYNAGSFSQNGVCKSVALWGSRRTNAAMAGWVG